MSSAVHMTLMIGPVVPIPVPEFMIDALDEVTVTTAAGSPSGFQLRFKINNRSELNTIFLIAVGLLWDRLRLGPRSRRLLFWSSIYGTYANFLGTLWAAVWGATGMMKVAAGGATGQPVHEGIVAFLLVSLSLAMLVVCGLLLRGLRWSPRSPPADPAR